MHPDQPVSLLTELVGIEKQVAGLKQRQHRGEAVEAGLIAQLETKLVNLTRDVYGNLAPPDVVKVARDSRRPHTLFYSRTTFSDFMELHGDGINSDDQAVVTGVAKLGDSSVMLIGHEKGETPEERGRRNSGSSGPGGYRKALKKMEFAAHCRKPIICLIDTVAADAISDKSVNEGISRAIAECILGMFRLPVPIIVVITGEGGSGGALGIGVGNRILMLRHAIYSVIPPEGCANILWKDESRAPEAATALNLTAPDALRLGVIDEIIPEPVGSASRDPMAMAQTLKERLIDNLRELQALSPQELMDQRYERFRNIGVFGVAA